MNTAHPWILIGEFCYTKSGETCNGIVSNALRVIKTNPRILSCVFFLDFPQDQIIIRWQL